MNVDWRIKPAASIHPDAFAALEQAAFGAASWGADSFTAGVGASGVTSIIVCAADEAAVGFAMWRALGEEGEILTLGVVPAFRRSGAGRSLLQSILNDAEVKGVSALFLEVDSKNIAARRLYEKHGFSPIGERRGYYKDGGDAVVLKRKI